MPAAAPLFALGLSLLGVMGGMSADLPHGTPVGTRQEVIALRPSMFVGGDQIELTREWRFHPGDDPAWSRIAIDDSGWSRLRPDPKPEEVPTGGWPALGWYRRHFRLAPELAQSPLTLHLEASGPTELYLDGSLLLTITADNPALAGAPPAGAWSSAALDPRQEHVLAVRHRTPAYPGAQVGFLVTLETSGATVVRQTDQRRRLALQVSFTAVPVFLALLHLALFWAYPKARENLFYAASMLSFAGIAICDLGSGDDAAQGWNAVTGHLSNPFAIAAIFFVLLTYLEVRTEPLSRSWRAFAALALTLVALTFFLPHDWGNVLKYVFVASTVVEVVRVELSGRKVEREGVRVFLFGILILNVAVFLQFLVDVGVVQAIAGVRLIYLVGTGAFALSMSIYLAREVARTHRNLEQRLVEVRTLSGQVFDQERAAYEAELRRQRLETETARQTAEIESARTLQLSMLPKELPEIPGLETAAAMTTASEVGGDYYDFRIEDDGSLLIAFGDATGHGVAAGIMVTAIKAIFSSLAGGEPLPEILGGCDRVLRRMNVKPFHMCMTVARINPSSVALCQAAMPPVLLYRAASGQAEELGSNGLPVGSRLNGSWEERVLPLAPGDTLLFSSDGFPELLRHNDEMLGFDRALETFRQAAGTRGPAQGVIDHLALAAESWRGEREPADDMTFVVVRTTG